MATVALANVAIGSITVVAVYAFVAVYFEDRLAALASAAVLACQPISIRYSASDSAHVLVTLGLFLAVTFTAVWMKRGGGERHEDKIRMTASGLSGWGAVWEWDNGVTCVAFKEYVQCWKD